MALPKKPDRTRKTPEQLIAEAGMNSTGSGKKLPRHKDPYYIKRTWWIPIKIWLKMVSLRARLQIDGKKASYEDIMEEALTEYFAKPGRQ